MQKFIASVEWLMTTLVTTARQSGIIKAVESDREDAVAYINRGTAHAKFGDLNQAIRDYDKAIELDPGIQKFIASVELRIMILVTSNKQSGITTRPSNWTLSLQLRITTVEMLLLTLEIPASDQRLW